MSNLTPELYNKVILWYNKKLQLANLKDEEMTLRREISNALFPDPKEGTNTFDLPENWVIKLQHSFNRKIDVAAFSALRAVFAEKHIPIDLLVDWKPSLSVSEYKKLDEDKRGIFDMCVITDVASPTLEITLPKKKKT